MKKLFLSILALVAVSALALRLVPATKADPDTITLYAGQNIPVGEVEVTNDSDNLYVTYRITAEGWCLTETHLHIGVNEGDFPFASEGKGKAAVKNVVPGHFHYKATHECVESYDLDPIPLDQWPASTELYIAAHAKVEQHNLVCEPMSDIIVSDEETLANGEPAVATWVHPGWTTGLSPDSTWIWTDELVKEPRLGETVTFTRDFEITGPITAGKFYISSDNTFSIKINGSLVADSLMEKNYLDVKDYDVTSYLNEGTNTLEVIVKNMAWNTDDPKVNPAGLIYRLDVDYEECEGELLRSDSAWAAISPGKYRFTDKGNWATWFTYTTKPVMEFIETVIVPANKATNSESIEVLSSENTYFLKAYGVADAGDTIDFDAKYSITKRIVNDTWTDVVSGYTSYGPSLLDLFVDNAPINWGAYSEDHIYWYEYTGNDAPVGFHVYDVYYPNNVGNLYVDIYQKLY